MAISDDFTQEPIMHVDATPDDGYPLRILQAYRSNCDVMFASNGDGSTEELNPVYKIMNDACRERAKILDRALALLGG